MVDETPLILLTRPRADAEGFAANLKKQGVTARIVISPIVEIVPMPNQSALMAEVSGASGVIFTSRNAVAVAPEGAGQSAWCVGPATAEAARAKGWSAVAAKGDADQLVARILADAPKGPLIHLCGAVTRGAVAQRLTAAGLNTREIVVYRQEARGLSEPALRILSQKSPVIVPLFSPRAAALFGAQGPFDAPLTVVTMSEAVKEALGGLPCDQVIVAAQKDAESMTNAITGLLDAG